MGEHIRRRRPSRLSRIISGIIGVIGELLITAAFVIGLFAVWQVYWTSYEVAAPVKHAVTTFTREHTPEKIKLGEVRTDAPPSFAQSPALHDLYGVVHVPKWDWAKIPLSEGIDLEVLNAGHAGHYPQTAQAGEIGNFSIAGHRRSYGDVFLRIDQLAQGDPVVVDLPGYYLVYTVESSEIVPADDPENIRVIAPVIGDASYSQVPTERWMTMTTCHPEYGISERYIVHLKFTSWTPKDTGVPAELLDEPGLSDAS
ncbi:class E sortase [Schaalia sp. ZJ405]|uniref:class E sortase n=1 Tax=Schaalia sp. ZJ405 TaxID=2709403 RepID=UPI0013EDD8B1|nr:class E sortase [Schaalia sp. ZJ405]QPK81430.1 class E sortase [Schaalia sp. ZJ405]